MTSTEDRHPASTRLRRQDPQEVLLQLLAAQVAATGSLRAAVPAMSDAALRAAAILRDGGRLAYAGAGSAGLMALADCLELAGTFGIPPDRTPMLFAGGAQALLHLTGMAEDDPATAATDFAAVDLAAGDAVICVSASGSTPYTVEIARLARAAGAQVIAIANVAGSPLLTGSDVPILLDTGPEVVTGSTRMGAGTAQKIALNMISTLIGVELGHVHDGYMVNVRAENAKLRDRAARIVSGITRCSDAAARAALAATGGEVKAATLVAAGATPAEAEALLTMTGGHLGPALDRLTPAKPAQAQQR